jgi:hypothetical protein
MRVQCFWFGQCVSKLIYVVDIGNARIAGLADDLKLTSTQYEWLLWAFYITYIAFEWMTLMQV